MTRTTHRANCLLALIACLCAGMAFAKQVDPAPDPDFPPAIIDLTLTSDGARMPGLIYLANGAGPHPTVVLLHGFPGNEKNLDIAQVLRRDGFNVLFFHYRGAWGADGEYAILNLPDDAAAVLGYLRSPNNAERLRVDNAKLSLLGHSMGGYAALAAGSRDTGLVCVGAMAPANVGQFKLALAANGEASRTLKAYADSLFMLRGYSGEAMRRELETAPLASVESGSFGPGLKGKSVFMVVGDRDSVTPAVTMFNPVIAEYKRIPGIALEHHVISGDHSFSWSRLALGGLVRDWMNRDCR